MKQYKSYIFWGLLLCLCLFLLPTDAYAADVFQTIKSKAAKFIRDLKPVIFILGGFGLIGFAFGAIFGKISWKWFANIAIGLFLVANVGLFIDYFASKDGDKGQYAESLGYGQYLDASGKYTATEGSDSDPKSQNATNQEGTAGDNASAEMKDDCVPGTGTGCMEVVITGKDYSKEKQNCTLTGGKWNSSSLSCEYEALNSPISIPNANTNTSSVPSGEQMNSLAQKAKEQYENDGKINMNQLLRDEVAAGRMTEEQAAQAGAIFTEVANSTGGNVGAAIDEVIKGSQEQIEEEEKAANDIASSAGNIGNLFGQIINEEAPDEEPLPGTGFENAFGIINEETPDEASLPGTGFENVYDADGGMIDEVVVTGQDLSGKPSLADMASTAGFDVIPSTSGAGSSGSPNSGSVSTSGSKNNSSSIANSATAGYSNNTVSEGRGSDNSTLVSKESFDTPPSDYDTSRYTEDHALVVEDETWLFDNQFTGEYYNPETGEKKTFDELQEEGTVKSLDYLKEEEQKNECMAKSSQGYKWVNGQCLSSAEVAQKEAAEEKEQEEKTKKYCKEGQKYIGDGDLGPICVDTEETKAKKQEEREKKLAEKEKECTSKKGYEWKNQKCVYSDATRKAKEECVKAKMKWNSETLTCEKTAQQVEEEKRANNPEIASKIDAQKKACNDTYTACRTEARKYSATPICDKTDPNYDLCYYKWRQDSQNKYNACSDQYHKCYENVYALQSQL